ncbi:MAG: dihydroorotase family protein [Actinobacteria bacterium]|nr:dihydroorotase family protein [Actinomycetota bacterium]
MSTYDLLIRGGTLVTAEQDGIAADIGVKGGRVAAIADHLPTDQAEKVVDASGHVVLPGGVDPHFHIGIYQPVEQDAFHETQSSLVGGVTTVVSYFRTGSHYLDKTGSYEDIFPEVIDKTAGHAHTDFGYHLAPMTKEQVGEIDRLAGEDGVPSFKLYMFYKGLNLAADSTDAGTYTMAGSYDLGHEYAVMEAISAANDKYADRRVSLSIHCEQSELLTFFIDRVRSKGNPQSLADWSAGRPPLSERVAIEETVALAAATGCPINLLHLSSREALETAVEARKAHPHMDIHLETTLHFLALSNDKVTGLGGKVNPPLRTADDIEALWEGVRDGWISWVGSDHACCMMEQKGNDLWHALPGFGGTGLLYPVLLSEGYHKRDIPLSRIVQIASTTSAKAYGLYPRKGTIAVGSDADFAIVDLDLEQTVTTGMLLSAQDHTPFAGVDVKGWPTTTILRGKVIYQDGKVMGPPIGRFIKRPV